MHYTEQKHQTDAINAVCNLFLNMGISNEKGYSLENSFNNNNINSRNIDLPILASNFNKISTETFKDSMKFDIEMETGTGKTYTFLSTIFELYKQYNWHKFILVVPSIAIKQGTKDTLRNTRNHFYAKYGYYINHIFYKNIKDIVDFHSSSELSLLVMTSQSFNKEANIINNPHEITRGEPPINLIRELNPILVLDEPQKFEGKVTKEALNAINHLFTIRYSATHKEIENLVYKLDPIQAYQQKLVKSIEIASVVCNDIELVSVNKSLVAEIRFNDHYKKLKVNDVFNLSDKSFTVDEITRDSISLIDNNGKVRIVKLIDKARELIYQTILLHKEKQNKAFKVLSLFFIEKVEDFRGTGDSKTGGIANIFREEYRKVYGIAPNEDCFEGYFSKDSKSNSKEENEETTYEKIIKDRHKLIGTSPIEFIFSHSALREGWDVPNIFQICSLGNLNNNISRRQSIGRGMRLAVDYAGTRINKQTIFTFDSFDTELFIKECEASLYGEEKRNERKLKAYNQAEGLNISESGVSSAKDNSKRTYHASVKSQDIGNIVHEISKQFSISNKIICSLFRGHYSDISLNPIKFKEQCIEVIEKFLSDNLQKRGLKYSISEKTCSIAFPEKVMCGDSGHKSNKALYDIFDLDSDNEREFAKEFDKLTDITSYVKLPSDFVIPTPIGNYNPDWAILLKNGDLYFIVETKGGNNIKLSEENKIYCAKTWSKVVGVDFEVHYDIEKLIDSIHNRL